MFTPIKTMPKNKYFITKDKGGYSPCIEGKPINKNCNVLSNCVGWAVGRFNMIVGKGNCNYLYPCNACYLMNHLKGLKTGKKAKLGACMVWEGGNDKCGHCAIVEGITKDGVIASDSVYGGDAFRLKHRSAKDNYGMPSNYKFLGFIYNPAITTKDVLELRKAILFKKKIDIDYDGDGKATLKDVLILRKSVY